MNPATEAGFVSGLLRERLPQHRQCLASRGRGWCFASGGRRRCGDPRHHCCTRERRHRSPGDGVLPLPQPPARPGSRDHAAQQFRWRGPWVKGTRSAERSSHKSVRTPVESGCRGAPQHRDARACRSADRWAAMAERCSLRAAGTWHEADEDRRGTHVLVHHWLDFSIREATRTANGAG